MPVLEDIVYSQKKLLVDHYIYQDVPRKSKLYAIVRDPDFKHPVDYPEAERFIRKSKYMNQLKRETGRYDN